MAAIDRSLLVNLPLFADLPAGDLDDLLADAVPVRFSKGAHIFEQGGEAHSFFVLLHGHVRAEKTTPDGEQIVVRYVAPGEAFGIAQALRLKQYPATAIAVVDCLVITWPAGAWQRLAGKYPRLAANTLQMVGNRLQEEHARILEISTQLVDRRIASALLRLAKRSGRKTSEGVEIDFPISRQDIAEMTGTTLHTASRILSAWEQQGLIASLTRQRITLRNLPGLLDIAEDTAK
jgi:CRP-like cAMP-binding protein